MKIDNMNEEQVKNLIKQEMDKNYNSGSPRIPPHRHDGTDNLRVEQKNIISNTKSLSGIQADTGGGTATINLVFNPSSLKFYGIAYNSGATIKATITGQAELGNCTTVGSLGSAPITSNVIYACDSFLVNYVGASPTFTVGTTSNSFASADSTNTLVSATVTSFTNNSITINVTLASGWILIGNLIIT